MDLEVCKATMAEVEAGSLEGPFDLDQLAPKQLVSPRFGIRQGSKVRPIDNLSASGINSTVGLPEKLQVDTIDEISALVKRCMQVHGSGCKLVGRTYDLKRAYRQLAVHEDHLRFARIAVWSPSDQRVKFSGCLVYRLEEQHRWHPFCVCLGPSKSWESGGRHWLGHPSLTILSVWRLRRARTVRTWP